MLDEIWMHLIRPYGFPTACTVAISGPNFFETATGEVATGK